MQHLGLFQKWLTLDPKKFYAISSEKLVFLISLYPEFLEKERLRNVLLQRQQSYVV